VKTEQSMEHGDEAGGRESFICSGWALACVCDGAWYLLDGEEGDGREGGGGGCGRRRNTTRGDGRSIAARAFPNCGSLPWHCHGVQYLCQRQHSAACWTHRRAPNTWTGHLVATDPATLPTNSIAIHGWMDGLSCHASSSAPIVSIDLFLFLPATKNILLLPLDNNQLQVQLWYPADEIQITKIFTWRQ
jgi:hypothetical protein